MISLRVNRANGDWESYRKKADRMWKVTLLITPPELLLWDYRRQKFSVFRRMQMEMCMQQVKAQVQQY